MDATLNQKSWILDTARKGDCLSKQYTINFGALKGLTVNQYKRFLALYYNKKFQEFEEMLNQFIK